jgi:hypothetical protein
MSLTISDTTLDEEFRVTQAGTADDNDVAVATFNASAVKTSIDALSLNLLTGFSGFPQHAEKTNFVSSTNPVTNYFLTSNSSGSPFPAGGTATSLYVGTNQIFLFPTSNENIVVGRVGTGTTADPTGAVAIIIGIDETVSGGFVTNADMWICQFGPIAENGLNVVDSADQLDLTGLVYLGSNFDSTTTVPFENFDGVPSGNNLFNVIFPSAGAANLQLLLTGSASETLSTINVSTTGIGSGSQHIDVGATLRIDTVTGMVKDNVNSAPEVNNSGNIDYTGRVELVAADFEITQLNPGSSGERADLRLSAFNAAGAQQEGAYLTDAIAADGTPVQIDAADIIVLNGAGQNITASLTILQDGDSVIIRGLDDGTSGSKTDGYQVFFTTDGIHFDRFLITNVDASTTFDVGNIHVTSVSGGPATEYAELGSKLNFQDDGPKITASGGALSALTADDSTLGTDPTVSFAAAFNAADYGADGQGSLAYALGISSTGAATGLVETSTGDAIFLFLESGKVVGRSGDDATAAASGPVVFEIGVDSSGVVKLDEKSAVVHSNTGSNDESTAALTASLITLTATARDSEATSHNDGASASVNIGATFLFKDDGPGIDPSNDVSAPNDLQVANKTDSSGQDSSFYLLTPGNDGLGSFTIQGPADSSGDFTWQYFDVDGSGTAGSDEIKGFYKGSPLYTLEVNSDGTYAFKMIGTLPGSTLDLSPAEVIKAGAPNDPILQIGAVQNDDYVQMTADSTIGTGNINESHGFVGVDNGNLDAGESLTFTLHESDGDPLTFQGIQIGTKSAQGGQYSWSAHLVGGGTISSTTNELVVKNGVLDIDATDLGGATIDSITITKVTGSATKIGVSDIHIIIQPNDVQLGFTAVEKDGDNDAATANFVVDIDGNNDGVYDATVNSLSVINPESLQLSAFPSPLDTHHALHHTDYGVI